MVNNPQIYWQTFLQRTSIRSMPCELSAMRWMFASASLAAENAGQPQPEWNLDIDLEYSYCSSALDASIIGGSLFAKQQIIHYYPLHSCFSTAQQWQIDSLEQGSTATIAVVLSRSEMFVVFILEWWFGTGFPSDVVCFRWEHLLPVRLGHFFGIRHVDAQLGNSGDRRLGVAWIRKFSDSIKYCLKRLNSNEYMKAIVCFVM